MSFNTIITLIISFSKITKKYEFSINRGLKKKNQTQDQLGAHILMMRNVFPITIFMNYSEKT